MFSQQKARFLAIVKQNSKQKMSISIQDHSLAEENISVSASRYRKNLFEKSFETIQTFESASG